jgi:hypothetical protein
MQGDGFGCTLTGGRIPTNMARTVYSIEYTFPFLCYFVLFMLQRKRKMHGSVLSVSLSRILAEEIVLPYIGMTCSCCHPSTAI